MSENFPTGTTIDADWLPLNSCPCNFFPSYDPEQGNHNRDNQKYVDQAANRVRRNYSDEPQYDQNKGNCQKHNYLLSNDVVLCAQARFLSMKVEDELGTIASSPVTGP